MSATLHVVYDPTNTIQLYDKYPPGVRFVSLKSDIDHATTDKAIGALAERLAKLLLEQL